MSAGDAAVADSNTSCVVAGNLVSNGDFALGASGFRNSGFVVEPAVSPCGKALRLTSSTAYAGLGADITTAPGALAKGKRFRLRAMFRDPGRDAGNPPVALVRAYHRADGGEVYTQTITVESTGSAQWHTSEISAALEQDEDRLELYIVSRSQFADAFEVSSVSLVAE